MKVNMALAAVSLHTALKYRRDWNKDAPTVKALQAMMPKGQAKKGYRLYIPIGKPKKAAFVIPPAVRYALTQAGFVATDYLAKKCVKITDKEQKNVFNIGKVIAKYAHAKQAFDNDPQLQNSTSESMQLVISCHPYDVIGMSTGRDWDKHSCMRLDDGVQNKGNSGQYSRHVKNDVAEGTLVAYAIETDDTNIQSPKCRCLIKPFYSEENGGVLYRRETKIYGNPVPGFDIVLNKFLRHLNKEAASGHYNMARGLYDDGQGTTHYHTKTDPNALTYDDAIIDPSVAEEFFRQQMEHVMIGEKEEKETGVLADQRRYATLLMEYLEKAEGLKKPQLKAIADLVKGSEFMASYLTMESLKAKPSHAMLYVARRSGALDKLAAQEIKEELEVTKALRFARLGNSSAFKQLEIPLVAPKDLDQEENAADAVNDIFEGRTPVPPKEVLQQVPFLSNVLFTLASAARYMPLFGKNIYQDVVYQILENVPDISEKFREHSLLRIMKQCDNGAEWILGYLMDNVGRVSIDDWYEMSPRVLALNLANRRAFKAFDKLDDGQAQRFMTDIKIEQIATIIRSPAEGVKYKGNVDALRSWLESEPDYVSVIGENLRNGWHIDELVAFAKFSMKSFVTLYTENQIVGQPIHVLLNKLIPVLRAYDGETLAIESPEVELLVQIAHNAGKLLDHPVTLMQKFDFEILNNMELSARFNKMVTSKTRGGPYNNLADCFSRMDIDGETPNTTHDMELVMSLAPYSLGSLPKEILVQKHRMILKDVAQQKTVADILKSIESMADTLQPEETEDADDYVSNNTEMPDVNDEHEDFDELYQENEEKARNKVEAMNTEVVDRNAKCLQVMQQLINFLGTPDDFDAEEFTFGYDTPNITREDIVESAEDIENAIGELHDNLERYTEEHEEYKEQAGY